jgi:tetratricopeptide (TPR) repeat protein
MCGTSASWTRALIGPIVDGLGSSVDRYEILRALDGARRLAFDATLDRMIVLETSTAGDVEEALRRARAFAALDDPGLAAIHDIMVVEDRVVLAREHVVGRPFASWARAAGGWRPLVAAVTEIARALQTVHAAGLFVGNFDAEAIVVADDGRATIVAPVLATSEGSPTADRVALCSLLADTLRSAGLAPPKHLAELDGRAFAKTAELVDRLSFDPARRRRRMLVRAGALAVAGLAVIAYLEARRTDRGACRGAELRLAGVWDPQIAARLRGALEATATPFAAHVADTVEATLDRYAEQWVHAHAQACEEARGQDERELAARTSCLDERRDALASLIGVLAQPDEIVVRNAVDAAQNLEPAIGCLDDATRTPADSEAARALRRELSLALAQQNAGKYGDGLTTAAAVRDAADALHDDALVADALRLEGTLQWKSGDPRTADATLERAVVRAWDADRDEIAAMAWTQLVYVRAELLGEFAAAHVAARHAEATLDRIGPHPRLAASLYQMRGILAVREGRYGDAIAEHQAALDERLRSGAGEDEITSVLTDLANAQVMVDRIDDARVNQARALASRVRLLGEVHPDTALARGTLAGILHAANQYEEALAEERLVHEVRVKTLGEHHPLTLKSLANVGGMLVGLERWDEGERVLVQALEDTRRYIGVDEPNIFFLLVNLALVAEHRGDHQAAYDRCTEARRRLAASPDHPNVAITLQCQARALRELGRPDEAIVDFREALARLELRLGPDHKLVARALTDLGTALLDRARSSADRAEGVAALQRALAIHERRGSPPELVAPARDRLAAALADPLSPARGTGGQSP